MLDWLKPILGEAYTEEIDKQVSAEIGKAFVSKTDFNAKNDALKTAQGELKAAQDTMAELEKAKGNAAELQKQIDQYKQAEAERQEAERQAAARAEIAGRFDKARGEREFSHEYIRSGVLADFEKALADDANKGKGDAEIFDALTKDKDGIFKSMNPPAVMRGAGGLTDAEIDDAKVRQIMGLPPKT